MKVRNEQLVTTIYDESVEYTIFYNLSSISHFLTDRPYRGSFL